MILLIITILENSGLTKPIYSSCFFFQAEDGIRDLYVTGVQTCALPISYAPRPHRGRRSPRRGSPGHVAGDEHRSRRIADHGPRELTARRGQPSGSHGVTGRSEEHTSELQSRRDLVCRLLLEKKKKKYRETHPSHIYFIFLMIMLMYEYIRISSAFRCTSCDHLCIDWIFRMMCRCTIQML